MNFFDTQAGYNFCNYTLPALIDSFNNLSEKLDKLIEKEKKQENIKETFQDIVSIKLHAKLGDIVYVIDTLDNNNIHEIRINNIELRYNYFVEYLGNDVNDNRMYIIGQDSFGKYSFKTIKEAEEIREKMINNPLC